VESGCNAPFTELDEIDCARNAEDYVVGAMRRAWLEWRALTPKKSAIPSDLR
jgi:hypothetical protein